MVCIHMCVHVYVCAYAITGTFHYKRCLVNSEVVTELIRLRRAFPGTLVDSCRLRAVYLGIFWINAFKETKLLVWVVSSSPEKS